MKCKICGFDIEEGQTNCPGCGTGVEELKKAGNISYENEDVAIDFAASEEVTEMPVEEPTVEEGETLEEIPEVPASDEIDVDIAPISDNGFGMEEKEENQVDDLAIEDFKLDDSAIEPEVVEDTLDESTTNEEPKEEMVEPSINKEEVDAVGKELLEEAQKLTIEPLETPAETPKKKGKLPLILTIVLVIILLLGGCAIYIHFIYGSGASVVSRALTSVKSKIMASTDETIDNLSANVKLNYTDKTGDTSLAFLNDLSLNVVGKAEGENGYAKLTLNYGNATVSVESIVKDSLVYLYAPDLYDKYLSVPLDNEDIIDVDMEEYTNLLSHEEELKRLVANTIGFINNELATYSYTKEYKKISLANEEKMAAVITLNLNQQQLKTLFKNVYTSMKNSDQFVKDLTVLLDTTKEEVSEALDEVIASSDITLTNLSLELSTDLLTSKIYAVNVKTVEEDGTLNLTYEKRDKGYFVKLDSKGEDANISLTYNSNAKNFVINVSDDTMELGLTLTYDTTNKNLTIPEVTDAVNLDELTMEDMDLIMENLSKNEAITKLMEVMMDNMDSYDEYELDELPMNEL